MLSIYLVALLAHSTLEIQGHRGSRGTHPENSFLAFEEAIQAKAQVLELDLHLTQDGEPIILHDAFLTGEQCSPISSPVAIRGVNSKQLSKYKCGGIRNPRFPTQMLSEHSPLLFEDFLKWLNQQKVKPKLNVEIKRDDPKELLPDAREFVRKVISLIQKHQLEKRTVIQSFDLSVLDIVHQIAPQLTLSCLFEIEKTFVEEALRHHCAIASPDYQLLTEQSIRSAHSKGLQVIPWTVNDEGQWKKLSAWKVDGIITDYPRKLAQFLISKSRLTH